MKEGCGTTTKPQKHLKAQQTKSVGEQLNTMALFGSRRRNLHITNANLLDPETNHNSTRPTLLHDPSVPYRLAVESYN